MKLLKYTYTILILMAVLVSFESCDDDDDSNLSRAVLASASSLSFEGSEPSPQTITVYADAEWVAEMPEWVSISPVSGTGVVDVTVSVTENMREGTLDNPRKDIVVFKGETLASRAEVIILQGGDKYRDVEKYTLDEFIALDDETVVSVPNVTVMALTSQGFVVSDKQNSNNVYVLSESTVNVGDEISMLGVKSSNSQSLPLLEADKTDVITSGGSVNYPEAIDITDQIDTYNASTRAFVAVYGVINGSSVSVDGANYSVSIIDVPSSLDLEALNGHRVMLKGYFDGLAAPVIKVLATDVEDLGVDKVIYYFEDFEWLDPWSVSKNAGRTVETDDLKATAPRITTPKIDGVSGLDALLERGYNFLRVTPTSTNAGECIYLQQNYLKFGRTGYQAGIILSKLAEDVPSNISPVLSFDWCPMRQGSGKIDPVNLIVIIKNGAEEVIFDIPEDGFENGQKLEWIRAEVKLTGLEITTETEITIRPSNWQLKTANRYFLDNIEISTADD